MDNDCGTSVEKNQEAFVRPILAITLTGSVFPITRSSRDLRRLQELIKNLADLRQQYDLIIVVGGGNKARVYQHLARACGLSNEVLDWIGIDITKINAEIIWRALEENLPESWRCPTCLDDAIRLFEKKRFLVTGGTMPGQTTDSVIVDLAIRLHLKKIYKLSNFNRLYAVDKNTGRKHFFRRTTFNQLLDYFEVTKQHQPGQRFPFDINAMKKLNQHKMTLEILRFDHLKQLFEEGHDIRTIISSEESL